MTLPKPHIRTYHVLDPNEFMQGYNAGKNMVLKAFGLTEGDLQKRLEFKQKHGLKTRRKRPKQLQIFQG